MQKIMPSYAKLTERFARKLLQKIVLSHTTVTLNKVKVSQLVLILQFSFCHHGQFDIKIGL